MTQQSRFAYRTLSAVQQKQHSTQLGASGEARAAEFLQHFGYTILEQNLRLKRNEVDLIVIDNSGSWLVFVEVKTRSTDNFGRPSQAVTRKKVAAMQRVALQYLRERNWTGSYRFDVISIVGLEIEHFKNVTW